MEAATRPPNAEGHSGAPASAIVSSSAQVPSKASPMTAFFGSPAAVYAAAMALRLVLLVYGLWQDANSPVKYTDIDYLVFTDASRFVSRGQSPYGRETYRYTPLLAWLLVPAGIASDDAESGWLATQALFAEGKLLFIMADLVAGWMLERVIVQQLGQQAPCLSSPSAPAAVASRARMYASVWLLNPMVAAISTRGSAEGLLGALVAALLWAVQVARQPALAGILLGAGVHLKIYPFIYAPAIIWWMDDERCDEGTHKKDKKAKTKSSVLPAFFTSSRLTLTAASLVIFFSLNVLMFALYGFPFLQHTYFHHVTRIDHRHNFSPYNAQLYLSSASVSNSSLIATAGTSDIPVESLAFLPQLLLSTVLLPLTMAKKDLPTTMLAQTFAFVTFNKVCTSQYFLWYMVLLPTYLPRSSLIAEPRKGITALVLWILGQAAWLQQGFQLEFLGHSTFVPGLWLSSIAFYLVNCWILGIIVADVTRQDL